MRHRPWLSLLPLNNVRRTKQLCRRHSLYTDSTENAGTSRRGTSFSWESVLMTGTCFFKKGQLVSRLYAVRINVCRPSQNHLPELSWQLWCPFQHMSLLPEQQQLFWSYKHRLVHNLQHSNLNLWQHFCHAASHLIIKRKFTSCEQITWYTS